MMGNMVTHKNIRISGRVQGVGFRYATRQAAFVSGIKGFVRNLPDGDVYIEAEGSADNMEQFIAWCRQGPPRAIVKHVDIYGGDNSGFQEFVIR